MRNNTTLLLALFLVFSALVSGGGGRPAGNSQPGSAKRPAAGTPTSDPFLYTPCAMEPGDDPLEQCKKCPLFCAAKGLLDTIQESVADAESQQPAKAGETAVWGVPPSQSSNIDFVIAVLPDPVHTHLNLLFDRNIEAIQKGAQASGQRYLFSRAWMPWREEASPEQDDFRLRAQEKTLQDRKEDLPGIMVFRRERCSKEERRDTAASGDCEQIEKEASMLFVLVVGETPTGGVHSQQFKNAMSILRGVRNLPDDKHQTGQSYLLKILGTSFSGSLNSLAELLASSELRGFARIEVESGTTTDTRSITRFEDDLKALGKKQGLDENHVRFVPMQENDDYGYEHLVTYLGTLGYKPKDIALVSEDETAYGRIEAKQNPGQDDRGRAEDTPKFYFPRDIAQLRASYQKDMDPKAGGMDTKQAPRSSLPLNLDVTGSDDDSVHSYADLQTPLSQEAILKGIVSNLQKHHSKFVIVRATNVLDSLFLCQYLRSAYPSGGLMIFGSDLLFQQDPDDAKLRGVLSVTTYPLLPGIDDETSSTQEHADQVFADGYSAGVFNATISLLSTQKDSAAALLEWPREAGSYASYGWPRLYRGSERRELPCRPALWLAEMGKGGYWPMALLDEPSEAKPQPASAGGCVSPKILTQGSTLLDLKAVESGNTGEKDKKATGPGEEMKVTYGMSWKILWWIAFLVLGVYVYRMLIPPCQPRSEVTFVFSLPGEKTRNAFLFLGGLVLIGVLLCFIYPWVYGASPKSDLPWVVLPLASLLGLAAGGYQGLKYRESPWMAQVFGVIALVLLVIAIYGVSWGFGEADSSQIFFARRFTHIESGLSPVAPLYFLLGGFLWCLWYGLDTLQFNDPELHLLPAETVYDEDCLPDSLQRRRLAAFSIKGASTLFDVMRPLCREPWAYVPGVFVIVALAFVLRFRMPVVILENNGYSVIICIFLGISLYLLIGLVTRLVMVWMSCKSLLQRMEGLKLRRSFRLQSDFEWGTLWRLATDAGVLNLYQQVGREMEALGDFLKFEKEFKEGGEGQGWSQEVIGRIQSAYQAAANAVKNAGVNLRSASECYWRIVDSEGTATISDRARNSSEMRKLTMAFHNSLSESIGKILVLLALEWEQEPPTECGAGAKGKDGADTTDKEAKKNKAPHGVPPERPEVACAERCVCLYFLILLLVPLRRIRSLVFGISGLYVFLLLALTSFHFEPHLTIRTGMIALFLGALACIGYVYSQIYRNRTLSRITGTSEASLGWDFWGRMAGFVAVPVLSLLAAQFPELNRFLFSWLEPTLQSFH